jgi:galactonate dehydratase
VKIERLETFLVAPRWLFLRLETDEGAVGWGEPVVEGRAETVRAAVHELGELIVGADPLRIEDHWQVLSKGGFYRDGPILSSALAGIDQALWDIAGKVRAVPVHELLGGPVRDRARVYGWIGGDDAVRLGEQAAAQAAAGFTALKLNACGAMPFVDRPAQVARLVARVGEVRAVLGDERDIALDFHGRVSIPMARRLLRELEPLQPLFVEEPVLPEHGHALPALVAATTIPLACGERLYSRWDFRPVLEAGVAVAQPDVSHAGGISEVRRIAALAEVYGAGLAPHCPLSPISLAASLQVAFATPNFVIQEQGVGIHYNRGCDVLDYLLDPAVFAFADGHVARPLGPGLGIEIDEDAVRAAGARGHRWRSPVWRHADGAFAEW